MTVCVIDTNVLVKRVIPEYYSDIAVGIPEQHHRGDIGLISRLAGSGLRVRSLREWAPPG